MGEEALGKGGVPEGSLEVVHRPGNPHHTTAEDTNAACENLLRTGAEVIVFCGGDGTARDVLSTVDGRVPILGVPAGVKMHSGVFGITPVAVSETLIDFLEGRLDVSEAEVIDLDEDRYREGEWNLRIFGTAKTPYEPSLIQGGKVMVSEASERGLLEDIAECIEEDIEEAPKVLWILGPGGTLRFIGEWLKVDKTLLGIDAVSDKKLVGKDLHERGLLGLLARFKEAKIVVSPIGAQGFFLGRGNLQLSPDVVWKVGVDNFLVVSTPAKLARTPVLRVDTGDDDLNQAFAMKGYIPVMVGYRTWKLVPIEI
jgi:predicted polyphosphate/ATP-dependent NAD kinase